MKHLTETAALALLQQSKQAFKREIKIKYEHKAQDCRTCSTPGVCCTDAHFVNVHITRLEAVLMRETLERTPRLDDAARRRIYERARATVARYDLRVAASGDDSFRQTYSCPLFEPQVGCVVHARAKPAPCVHHACYENWEDLPPAKIQWTAEHRIEQLNNRAYGTAWAWLPTPLWLTLVDPEADEAELERLIEMWRARRPSFESNGNAAHRARLQRRRLPVLIKFA